MNEWIWTKWNEWMKMKKVNEWKVNGNCEKFVIVKLHSYIVTSGS